MYSSSAVSLLLAALVSTAHGHGVLTSIQGANGVTMPGLSVIDGTPRDCATPGCGAEADTSVIRQGDASPLGKTQGGGPVQAANMIGVFMGTASAKANPKLRMKRGLLDGLLGGGAGGKAAAAGGAGGAAGGLGGLLGGAGGAGGAAGGAGGAAGGIGGLLGGAAGGGGTKTPQGTQEGGVAKAAGAGAAGGLPTADQNGQITMTFHQVNQDGAGPLTAAIDPSSGGTDEAAFVPAQMGQNVPGAIAGLSTTTTTDFPITVQMPAGMKCTGSVGGANNVCIVRVKNNTPAGPFGGSAAFTQDTGAAGAAGNATANAAAAAGKNGVATNNKAAA